MFFRIRISLFCLIVTFVYGKKTDTFPPDDLVRKHYDVTVNQRCAESSGVDKNEIIAFEMATDLGHLPNSDALRSYILCYSEGHEFIDMKLSKLTVSSRGGAFLMDLTKEDAEIYLVMMKGCVKNLKGIKDRTELAYQYQVCWKKNDNEHYYIYY